MQVEETKEKQTMKTEKEMAEAVLKPLDENVNRNSKDSVFCNLFSDPQYVLQVYQALHPEDDITGVSEITVVTLEHILLREKYNDLGFIIGNRLLILVEAQSTWTENILIRFLSYLGSTYHRYIKRNEMDVYGAKKLELPEPELYVIYHGERGNKPEEIYLSTEFYGRERPGSAFIELKAKVLYGDDSGDIIDQYIVFCRVFDEQVKLHGRTRKAIEETIRICRSQNVLKEYLARKEAEEVMSEVFEKEESMKLWEKDLKAEGRAEGRAEGSDARSKEIYERMIASNIPEAQERALAFG